MYESASISTNFCIDTRVIYFCSLLRKNQIVVLIKKRLYIIIFLISVFNIQLITAYSTQCNKEDMEHVMNDVEDNGSSGEDSKPENQLKEYNFNTIDLLMANKMVLYSNLEFGHVSQKTPSKIILDVVTPPPEA